MRWDGHIRNAKTGKCYLPDGDFAWWPVQVRENSTYPKEVPVLEAKNFDIGRSSYDSDKRTFEQWLEGFPLEIRRRKMRDLIHQTIKEVCPNTPSGLGSGRYRFWHWVPRQSAETLAAVWNQTMRHMGYDV